MIKWAKRLTELIGDWIFLVKRDGWKSSRSFILKEIARLPYRRMPYFVLAYSLSDPVPEFQPKRSIDIRPFAAKDLEFVRREYLPSEANLCRRRLSQGQRGLMAFIDGQAAGYCWLACDDRLERVRLSIGPGDILAPSAFTAPDFRNKGVKTALAIASLHLSRELGYARILTYIEVNNIPSLNIWQKKLGSQVIARLDFRRIGFWRISRYH